VAIEFLIIDANVLIDFCKTERSVLALVTKHVGTVHVADPVLAEVKELDRAGAEALGINVLTPEFPMLSRAATASVRSPLRFEDWLCLLIAEEESWTCVTNDKRLRAECETREVAVLWGFQLLLRLIERKVLKATEAITIAESICRINRRIPDAVLVAFRRKARSVK
jgi:predicted nucleic acid-binding protein